MRNVLYHQIWIQHYLGFIVSDLMDISPPKTLCFFLPQYVMSVGEFILVKDGVDITKSINYDNLQPATMTGSIIIKLSQGNRVSDVLSK